MKHTGANSNMQLKMRYKMQAKYVKISTFVCRKYNLISLTTKLAVYRHISMIEHIV